MSTTHEATNVEAVRSMTNKEMVAAIVELQRQVAELQAARVVQNTVPSKEMTDDDARRILNGDCKDLKHKDAAVKLGLSYGQVYSCRLGFTFKNIHKELKAAGWANPWVKD